LLENNDNLSKEVIKEDGLESNQKLIRVSNPPFPNRLKINEEKEEVKEIRKLFKQINVNIPLLELIRKIPSYGQVLRDCCLKK
jgi:hypothetical protein